MLLTLTTTHRPATDLGFLLHKHPERVQSFALPFGQAHVVYPEASPERLTAALLLDLDPLALTPRGRGAEAAFSPLALKPYVNDRPYVASSFLSVALARVFGSALRGECKTHPELVARPLPLEATLAALPCRGGEAWLRSLFEPLGYAVAVTRPPAEPLLPGWAAPTLGVTLRHMVTLERLLQHLYLLIPVLDDEKHYWVGEDELDKLLRRGEGWLADHPERDEITRRYLRAQRGLAARALERLGAAPEEAEEEAGGLHQARLETVHGLLKASGAARVLDLGCGEGRLLERLAQDAQFTEVVGVDVSPRALERAHKRLARLPEAAQRRVTLEPSSLLYRDARLAGFGAAALVEVVEHLEPSRLGAFERALFGVAKPKTVVLTTPNRDYNRLWPSLAGRGSGLRHPQHRFEWTRAEFQVWAERVAETYGYELELSSVGTEVPGYGAPTLLGVFRARA